MLSKETIFLVVGDAEPMRNAVSVQLYTMGASTILTACNGAEALHILQYQKVDIVLSELHMPVMSGLELLKAVRANATLSSLPLILITAEPERNHAEEAINNDVSDLLIKPYTAEILCSRINKVLHFHSHIRLLGGQSPAPRVEPASGEDTCSGPLRPTILIVDDSADSQLLLTGILKPEYQVRIANTGEKALQICQSNTPPDLLLLEILMPDMNGLEIARRMREHPTSENIPVIFLASATVEKERYKNLQLGAVDFAVKPIDPDLIRLRANNFMRYVVLNKQLQASYDDMQELARLRKNVEYITHHDMKSPLAGVIGIVQSLTYDNTLSSDQIRQLHQAENTAYVVLDMINLSSELFKIETGRFTLNAKPFKVSSMLRRIAKIARTAFVNKNIEIELITNIPDGSAEPMTMGDATLCYSMFQNLIKNACEAAPELSLVSITLHHEIPLYIVIKNKGVVPDEIRERFFDKFVTFGKLNGTGLGAYSAKALAVAQNGNVDMEVSDLENLTTITVTLPLYTDPVVNNSCNAI